MNRSMERLWPYGLAVVVACLFWFFQWPFPKKFDLFSASISLGSVFTGFLITFESIVVTTKPPRLEMLKPTKFYGLLLSYVHEAVACSILLCIASMVGFFFDVEGGKSPTWFNTLWVLFFVGSVSTFYRISRLLLQLLAPNDEES